MSLSHNSSRFVAALCLALLAACGKDRADTKLTVAAASNLTGVMDEIAEEFRKQSGAPVVFSYGSTAQLAQQIAHGAPFDVFAAADTEHVDQLVGKGLLLADTRAVYARGQLALWVPNGNRLGVREMKDLAKPAVRFVAVAQPELAPYGAASVEALKAARLWEIVRPKIVYASNITMTRQFAAAGNADAAFTAYSLVPGAPGVVVKIDPKLHRPIDQALGVVAASKRGTQGRAFAQFLLSEAGKAILRRSGYLTP